MTITENSMRPMIRKYKIITLIIAKGANKFRVNH